jgi:hypothetical protein
VKEKPVNEEKREDEDTKYFTLRSVRLMTKNGGQFHSLFEDKWYKHNATGFAIYDSPGRVCERMSFEESTIFFLYLQTFPQYKIFTNAISNVIYLFSKVHGGICISCVGNSAMPEGEKNSGCQL